MLPNILISDCDIIMSLPKLKNESFLTVSATGAIDGIYDVYFVDATGGAVTITLPAGSGQLLGRSLSFKRIDNTANAVTIQRAGSDTIDGGTSVLLQLGDVTVLIHTDITVWRTMQLEGSSGSVSFTTITTTGAVDGSSDLYIINNTSGANLTVTLPAASGLINGKTLRFRRIDNNDFSVTVQRAGTDTLTLTNSTTATSTTMTSSDNLVLTRTSSTAWTLIVSRPTFRNWILTADAPVTVTTNFDVWIAPTLGADRAFTLPLAASVGSGKIIQFANKSAANNIVLTRSGADVINAASLTFNIAANTGRSIISDGVSVWTVL